MPRVEPRPAAAATATWRRQRRRLHRGRWQCSPRRAAARSRFHRPPTLTASAPTREARAGSVRRAPASVLTGPMVASASSPSWSAMRRDRKMVAAPRRERRRPPASMRRGRPARLRREWQRRHQEDRRPPHRPLRAQRDRNAEPSGGRQDAIAVRGSDVARDIAPGSDERDEFDAWLCQCPPDRHGVVGAAVGVDDERQRAPHGAAPLVAD